MKSCKSNTAIFFKEIEINYQVYVILMLILSSMRET